MYNLNALLMIFLFNEQKIRKNGIVNGQELMSVLQAESAIINII